MDVNAYYLERKNFNYYKKVLEIVKSLTFKSIIDVGANRSPILENIDNSIDKVLIDLNDIPIIDGIRNIKGDFYTWNPDKQYDVVLCLQVLEHLENPKLFANKLFQIANDTVIISVPYKWKKGFCKYHVQDPVDLQKLKSWTNKDPTYHFIVRDNMIDRLICVYNLH